MTLVDAVGLEPDSRRRRMARLLRRGALLLGVLAALPFTLEIDVLFALVVVGGPLVPLFCLYLALALAGGRKSVVVYLRRFGRTRSGQAVTAALESGVSRRHRVVTLDDSRFPPLEVPPWERRLSRYGPALVAGLSIAFFVVTVRMLRQEGEYLFLWLSMGMLPVLAASLWSVLTGFLLLVVHRYRIRRLARARIASEHDLDAYAARLASLTGWWRAPAIAAPQATVLSVDDRMWQRAVEAIVGDSSAVLIDVSEPTANLVWEIETVLREAPTRTVLVGDRDAVTRWSSDASTVADAESARQIHALLDRRSILTYDVADRAGRRRFRQSLMRALDNVALARPVRRSVPEIVAPCRRAAAFLSVVGTYLLAPVLATALSYVVVKVAAPQPAIADLFLEEHHPLDRLGSREDELRRRGVPVTNEALARAAGEGKTEEVGLLVEAGVSQAPVTAGQWTPLLLAANSGNAEMLKTLIAAAAPVDARTEDGRSAIMLAAAGGHVAAATVLLDAGASVNTVAARQTALGLAIQGEHVDLTRLLLERGADVSTPHLGMSPLVLAAAIGRADMVEDLLARGANVDARSEAGRTPLGLAAIAGCRDCIRALLSKGARANEVDGFGRTAMSYATFNGDDATAALLAGAGAPPPAASNRGAGAARPGSTRSRRHVNLAILSAIDAQAPALVSAISKLVGSQRPRARFLPAEVIEASRHGRFERLPLRGLDAHGMQVELSTNERHYGICLPASDEDFRKASLLGFCRADVVVIVTAPDASAALLEDEVKMARYAMVPHVVIAIDVGRPGSRQQRPGDEATIRPLLARQGYSEASIIRLSSATALSTDEEGDAAIDTLMRALDSLPPPQYDRDGPLLMAVESVIPRANSTDIVMVSIEAGTVRIGDTVEIVGLGSTRSTTVEGISTFGKLLESAEAHDRVGVMLKGVEDEDVERGQVVAQPGSIQAHTQFEAIVYLFNPAEGGRLTPVSDGYRPFLRIRTAMATAAFDFPENVSAASPGTTVAALVTLPLTPVAMAPGDRFTVHEGLRTVGIGIVTQ